MQKKILVTAPRFVAGYLAEEIRQLGYSAEELAAGVITSGDWPDAVRLNYFLRTAHRVLVQLSEFKAASPQDLYNQLLKIGWEEYIRPDGYFSVHSFTDTSSVNNSMFASMKVKDAVADYMRSRFNKRPSSGAERKGVVIYLHWQDEDCEIYLDTSGETLARHGYRKNPWQAPLQETLAAAIIYATGWKEDEPFINPMCGSGTLAIEAAMRCAGVFPGALRDRYSFMALKNYDPAWYAAVKREARKLERENSKAVIIASDIDPAALEAAGENAAAAGVERLIDFRQGDFKELQLPAPPGIIVINPGYGQRIGTEEELEPLYADIGNFFKHKAAGFRGFVFTGSKELSKKIGLKTSRRIPFYNAEIECRLLGYELYEGKKTFRQDSATS